MLPDPWDIARQNLEQLLDKNHSSNMIPAIHAMEPDIPIVQSTDQETKWTVQLSELLTDGIYESVRLNEQDAKGCAKAGHQAI
ncbi:hypothetical protein PsorP6_000224 [Peronosclerospora sorghi]|uniref:Uncharacterized protein n=1 Tax=Peronosclerospora sorghi TaxID=230839 RepID=A0ACC0WVY2_9STRA|nr:hypothetical protein PsorP6_000224 [Peronosclerospora sorghi]